MGVQYLLLTEHCQKPLEIIVGVKAKDDLAFILPFEADLDPGCQSLSQFVFDPGDMSRLVHSIPFALSRGYSFRESWLFDQLIGGVDREPSRNDLFAKGKLSIPIGDSL